MSPSRRFLVVLGVLYLGLAFGAWWGWQAPEFRPFEIVKLGDQPGFRPNARVEMVAWGDLAFKASLPPLRVVRKVVFTVDRWGFRNARDIEHPEVVVVGDSYVVGSGLSDDQTLPARLGQQVGKEVYNYGIGARTEAGGIPEYAAVYLSDPRFREAPPAVVIYSVAARQLEPQPLEAADLVGPPNLSSRELVRPARYPLPTSYEGVGQLLNDVSAGFNRDNGLTRAFQEWMAEAEYRLAGTAAVTIIHPDGAPALVLSLQEQRLTTSPESRRAAEIVAGLVAFRDALRERGTRLVFCPVPESGTIYPELFPVEQRVTLHAPSLLDVVIAGAANEGVDVVDLRPVYQSNKSPYLYLRDDSHWNADTIDLTAREIARALGGASS